MSLSGGWRRTNPTVYEWRQYNGFDQLIRIVQDNGEIACQYRGDGLRHSREVKALTEREAKTDRYYWDGSNLAAEQRDGGKLRCYLRGLNLIASQQEGMVYYYLSDAHGDVVWLRNQNGGGVRSYEYDAFGNEKDRWEEDENPFRYCGEYFDVSSDTYYLRARDYRPETGRFLTEDPIGDGLNWYTYCSNNPVIKKDPSGLYEVYDPHTRSHVDIVDPIEASRYSTNPHEKLRILAESQGWIMHEGMSLELIYYVNKSPYMDGIGMAGAVVHGDLDFWYPLPEHQYLYWQGVEFGKGERATIQTLAAVTAMQARDAVPSDGSEKYGSKIDVSEQKMHQQGPHYNKHGRGMGYSGKKTYEQGARNFIENNRTTADIFEGVWNSARGIQSDEVQIIMRYAGEQVIINKATGQIIDFYRGTSLDGFIHIRQVQ